MDLNCICHVLQSGVNDVFICRDRDSTANNCYTLWKVHDHQTAGKLVRLFSMTDMEENIPILHYTEGAVSCFVLPYERERRLDQFYVGSFYSLPDCEKICISLVAECISCRIPYPVLYLVLEQGHINLAADCSVSFGFGIDLTELDMTKREKDCALKCASILLGLLSKQRTGRAASRRLLERKIPRMGYGKFTELYRDVRAAAASGGHRGLYNRARAFLVRHQDRLFRMFLVLCAILGMIAGCMLLSQIIWGDIPFMRLFYNPFRTIGTESMLQ